MYTAWCQEHGDADSCYIYIVTKNKKLTAQPPKKKAVDPLALAELLKVDAVVSLDQMNFRKLPDEVTEQNEEIGIVYYGYRPTDSRLWQTRTLLEIIGRIDLASHPDIKRDIQSATKIPNYLVQQAVDTYRSAAPHQYPESVWDTILQARTPTRALFGGQNHH